MKPRRPPAEETWVDVVRLSARPHVATEDANLLELASSALISRWEAHAKTDVLLMVDGERVPMPDGEGVLVLATASVSRLRLLLEECASDCECRLQLVGDAAAEQLEQVQARLVIRINAQQLTAFVVGHLQPSCAERPRPHHRP